MEKKHNKKFIARFVVEAETPLAVSNGEQNVFTDKLVATDLNGLPYIPGTSIAGVMRHSLNMAESAKDDLFGFQKGNDGLGSRLIFSSAQLVVSGGKVMEGLVPVDFENDGFFREFRHLPVRQHVRINHRGTTDIGGKFDEQVVYKGTRFCFEIELSGNDKDNEAWNRITTQVQHPAFRIGGGTRKGFGKLKVVSFKTLVYNFPADLDAWLDKSSSLNDPVWEKVDESKSQNPTGTSGYIKKTVRLQANDFMLFGSGFGDKETGADMSYVTEKYIIWEGTTPRFTESKALIPATSVKGALAHRTAFYYNEANDIFADDVTQPDFLNKLCEKKYYEALESGELDSNNPGKILKIIEENNPAVKGLFGYSAGEDNGRPGKVYISDIYLSESKSKLLNHVAIDRFTGGAREGALFLENVAAPGESFELLIEIEDGVEEEFLAALDKALDDLCSGMLPLGGGTMRGHGTFTGEIINH